MATAGLNPVRLGKVEFVMDLPLLLAAAFVLGPLGGGLVALVGATDTSDIHLKWTSRTLWNRAETAICTLGAGWVFSLSGITLDQWPATGLIALVALGADMILNYALVGAGAALYHYRSFASVVREMRLGATPLFFLSHLGFGFIGVLIAEIYRAVGLVGVLASVVPVGLAYQSLQRRRTLDETERLLETRARAIVDATTHMVDERREERLVIAGALHDHVLPPIFQVHLMGQVLRQDLDAGRLLDLDKDIPSLLEATSLAQGEIRGVVKGLRDSSIGPGGLKSALHLLVRSLESAGLTGVRLEVEAVTRSSPAAQLLIYQVVRESLTNAAKHARAATVLVAVWSDRESLRATITDDGVGFVAAGVDRSAHFGLDFMAERVDAAGGQLIVDSRLGEGTCIACRVPHDA